MASSSCLLLSATVLLAVLAAAAASAPSYCVPGQAIPRNPLVNCRWYVASQTCGAAPLLPTEVMKQSCCRDLEAIPADCRCKALRVMMEDASAAAAAVDRSCWHAQAEFAATVVTEAECGLRTIHGRPFCYALGAEY